MSSETNQDLFTAIDAYIERLYATSAAPLPAAIEASQQAGLPAIHVSPVQGKLLHLLALLVGARTILEIGTLGGYSAIWMAQALPPDGQLVTLEHNPDHARIARDNLARAGLAERVDIQVGTALDLLPALKQQVDMGTRPPFDLVFIDADKPPYVEYFQWARQMARPGALIIADNTLRGGSIFHATSEDESLAGIQRFNSWLAEQAGDRSLILPLVGTKGLDGLTLSIVE